MDRNPLAGEVERLAAVVGCTVDELLNQAAGAAAVTTPQGRALRAGWASADLAATPTTIEQPEETQL